MSVLSKASNVVYNSLPGGWIALALGNAKISRMENHLFTELGILKRLPGSMLPPEAMLVSMVHDVAWRVRG